MKKVRILLISALMLLMSALVSVACAEVVSTTPITGERFWGFRVLAVAVEYDCDLAAQEFDLDTFLATDLWDSGDAQTGLQPMDRVNSRIYTNSESAILAEGSAEGRYVIVEFVDDPLAEVRPGDLAQRAYYINPDNGKVEKPKATKPNDGTIAQLKAINSKDGTELAPFEAMGMTNDYQHPAHYYDFELLQIDIPARERPYQAYIHLPENMEEGKTYPVIFNLSGNSQMEYIGNGIDNTDYVLTGDHQLYAWTETRDYGFDMDLIVVSLRHKNEAKSIAIKGEDPYLETAQAAQWIIDNYPVDKTRLFWSGQSLGSVTCLNLLWRYPELATGYFGMNGGLNARADFSPEGWTQDKYDEAAECLNFLVDHNIKICFTFGEQDSNSANAYAAKVYYQILHDAWAAKGLSEREIDNMAKVRVFPHSTYDYAVGLTDHNVCRMMFWLNAPKIDAFKIVSEW